MICPRCKRDTLQHSKNDEYLCLACRLIIVLPGPLVASNEVFKEVYESKNTLRSSPGSTVRVETKPKETVMTKDQFIELIEKDLLPQCMAIMQSKGTAYSGKEDKLGNFKRCAKLSGSSVQQVWFTYFVKHFDALSSYIRDEYIDSEPIDGRIMDLINYLFLLYGIIHESDSVTLEQQKPGKELKKCKYCGRELQPGGQPEENCISKPKLKGTFYNTQTNTWEKKK